MKKKTPQINLNYENKYLKQTKQILLNILSNFKCKVFLFGSRANKSSKWGSDIDIGIQGIEKSKFNKIKSKFFLNIEESMIPFKIDIINFDNVDKDFKLNVINNKIIVWKNLK